MPKLNFARSLHDSCSICRRNAAALAAALLLWLSTIWIPGINIGTTIAVLLLPARLAEGAPIRPLEIFRAEYRRHMSDCFLMAGMMAVPIVLALTFVFFPGVVLLLAWLFSFNYLVLRGKSPVEAIRASNRATCGSKWRMLFVLLTLDAIPVLAGLLSWQLCKSAFESGATLALLTGILYIATTMLGLSAAASFWRQLGDHTDSSLFFPRQAD